MTRNRRLRVALLVAAAAWLAFLVLSIRPRAAVPKAVGGPGVAESLVKELVAGTRDRLRLAEFVYDGTRDDEIYRVRAAEALGFPSSGDDTFWLKDVVFESRQRGSRRVVTVKAPRAEFRQASKSMRVFEGVFIQSEGVVVSATAFRYEPERKRFFSEGAVAAIRGELAMRADAGEVQTDVGALVLTGAVRVRGRDESGRALDVAAPRLTLARTGLVQADGGVVVKTDELILRSDRFERAADGAGDRLRGTGHAAAIVLPTSSRAPAPIVAAGHEIELARDLYGDPARLTLLGGDGFARVDLAAARGIPPRRALAPRFDALFAAGELTEVTVPERLVAGEAVPARPGAPPGTGFREVQAGFARFTFAARPAASAGPVPAPRREERTGPRLDVANFDGGVRVSEGTRAFLTAARGTLRGVDDTAVFTGEPARPAEYLDEAGKIAAATLTYDRREERMDASGAVRASYAKAGGRELPGGVPGEPMFSESEGLRLYSKEKRLVLTGDVKAWQRDQVLRCQTLVLDDRTRTLRAEGTVRAVLQNRSKAPLGPPASGPAKKGPASAPRVAQTINASGDVLTHREEDRVVRIEGHSAIVSGSWVVKSSIADVKLAADRSIDYAEARGGVSIEDRTTQQRGDGTLATWHPATDLVTLQGEPAVARDGKGNKVSGSRLTFRQGSSRVDAEAGAGFPSQATLKPEGS